MGREIRRVPPDWEHPRRTAEECTYYQKAGDYKPLHDNDYESAAEEWCTGFHLWNEGEHPDQLEGYGKSCKYFWEYSSPPNEEYYRARKWTPGEATAYQIYETVSEGTPKSPVFLTLDDMKAWLIEQGYSREAAEGFTRMGFVPSGVMVGGKFYNDIEAAGIPDGKEQE